MDFVTLMTLKLMANEIGTDQFGNRYYEERREAPRRPVEAGCPRVCPRVEAGGRSSKACPSSRRPVPADEATDDDEEEEGEPSPREQRRKRAERFASRSFNPVAEEAEEARRRSMADPL